MAVKKWDRQRIIRGIHDWQRQGIPVDHIWRQDRKLASGAAYWFGSWLAALEAGGFFLPSTAMVAKAGNRSAAHAKLEENR